MNETIQSVLGVLASHHITYTLVEHIPVYTIDEIAALHLPNSHTIAKNLFIRDDKKKHYYVVVIEQTKTVNLKELRKTLKTRPLSFASESDLWNYMKLTKGAVTPLGILNDDTRTVTVIIDSYFKNGYITVHPNDNTASVCMASSDLISLLQNHGNAVIITDL